MTQKRSSLKRKLFKQIRGFDIKGLISISLIGSFQYSKKLDKVNDIDIIILVKKLTPSVFKHINKKFENLASNLDAKVFKFTIENKIGPIKPKPIYKKKIIQFHLLIYDLDTWKTYMPKVVKADAVNFNKKISGKQLDKVVRVGKIYKKDLLFDFERFLYNIEKNSIYVRIIKVVDKELKIEKKSIKVSKRDFIEFLIFVITTSFLNYLRFLKPNTIKNKRNLLYNAKKLLPLEYYSIIKRAFKIEELLRNRISIKTFPDLKNDTIKFVLFLSENLKK